MIPSLDWSANMSLQEIRKKKNYTVKELGAISGINYRTIQNLECGANDINSLKLESLCKLAIALDCNIHDLLTDEKLKTQFKLTLRNKD